MVEILPVGVAVDHAARELQLAHAAFELVGRGLGVLHRQMAEAGIAVGPLLHFAGEEVVAGARAAHGGGGVALGLHAGAGDRQHGALDAGAIHRFQPQLAEVGQPRDHLRQDVRIDVADGGLPVVFEARTQEVLFERDLPNHAFPRAFPCGPLYRNLVKVYQSAKQAADGHAQREEPDPKEPDPGDRARGGDPARAGEPGVGAEPRTDCPARQPCALDGAAHRRRARSREARDRGVADRPRAARADDPAAGDVGRRRFRLDGAAVPGQAVARTARDRRSRDHPQGSSGVRRSGDRAAAAARRVGGGRGVPAALHRQRQGLSGGARRRGRRAPDRQELRAAHAEDAHAPEGPAQGPQGRAQGRRRRRPRGAHARHLRRRYRDDAISPATTSPSRCRCRRSASPSSRRGSRKACSRPSAP